MAGHGGSQLASTKHSRPIRPDGRPRSFLGAVEAGADPIGARRAAMAVRSFAELSEEFLRLHVATKRKARTGAGYERLLALYILPAIGSRRLTDIRRSDVARLHAGLSDRPYTANRVVALISAIWNWASRRDEVAFEANPARGVERNPESGKERFLSADEMARLGDVMRRGETEGLAWDVDETKPTAKHVQKDGRVIVIDHHAVAAIRLLIQ